MLGDLFDVQTATVCDQQEELLTCIFQPQPIPMNEIPRGEKEQVLMIMPGR